MFRSNPTIVTNRIRRNCIDGSEFAKSRLKYLGYLTNAGYKTDSIDNAFNVVENLSQETLVHRTNE